MGAAALTDQFAAVLSAAADAFPPWRCLSLEPFSSRCWCAASSALGASGAFSSLVGVIVVTKDPSDNYSAAGCGYRLAGYLTFRSRYRCAARSNRHPLTRLLLPLIGDKGEVARIVLVHLRILGID